MRKECRGPNSPCWACPSVGRRRGHRAASLSPAGSAAGTTSWFLGETSDLIIMTSSHFMSQMRLTASRSFCYTKQVILSFYDHTRLNTCQCCCYMRLTPSRYSYVKLNASRCYYIWFTASGCCYLVPSTFSCCCYIRGTASSCYFYTRLTSSSYSYYRRPTVSTRG